MRMGVFAAAVVGAACLAGPATGGQEPAQKEPSSKAAGEVLAWKSADGLAYDDVVPVFRSARRKGLAAYADVNRKT